MTGMCFFGFGLEEGGYPCGYKYWQKGYGVMDAWGRVSLYGTEVSPKHPRGVHGLPAMGLMIYRFASLSDPSGVQTLRVRAPRSQA